MFPPLLFCSRPLPGPCESPHLWPDFALKFVSELLTIILLNGDTDQLLGGDSRYAPYGIEHMGQLIEFVPRKAALDEAELSSMSEKRRSGNQNKSGMGQLLFFTGVRYERSAMLPSERLKLPIAKS